jgi:hypothetical protein
MDATSDREPGDQAAPSPAEKIETPADPSAEVAQTSAPEKILIGSDHRPPDVFLADDASAEVADTEADASYGEKAGPEASTPEDA